MIGSGQISSHGRLQTSWLAFRVPSRAHLALRSFQGELRPVRANKVAGRLQCKAAVEAPPREPTEKSKKATKSAEFTPEEAADVYRDMKLGRDFEEM